MDKVDKFQNESASKGNSEDSLLAIYILSILKKYSSRDNKLSSQDVMDYLREDYSIGNLDKADAQRKKVRRHLDTLCESYWDGSVEKIEGKLGFPVIVKPANLGSSVGIKAAHNREELIEAIENAIQFTNRIIIEKYVQKLKEVNCAVLGNYYDCQPSVCEVPVRSGEILSYQDKYMSGGGKQSQGMQSTVREIPANLPEETTKFIQNAACETFRALACDGVSRIDFIIDEATGEIFVNEINTIPGSLSFYLWEYSGINFSNLVDRLIEIAIRRQQDANQKVVNYGDNIFSGKAVQGAKMGAKTGGKFGGGKFGK